MEWIASIAWIVTAGGGFVLLAIWLGRGGMRRGARAGASLAFVAALGWTMFAIWYRRRQAHGAVREAVDPGSPAEQRFPVAGRGGRGGQAVTTVVLVFLTAVGVGD
jgi:hypothetical protein